MENLILIGAGRHPVTKELRRSMLHQRRTFYIGDLHVMSNKRFPVTVEFVQQYFSTIVAKINEGTLLVQYKSDRFVTPAELKVLCYGDTTEKQSYEQQIAQADAGSEMDAAEPELALPEQDSGIEGLVTTFTAPIEPDAEPVIERSPEMPPPAIVAVDNPELSDAAESVESLVLVSEDTAEVAVPEPESQEPVGVTTLPEGWKYFAKGRLLELAESLGIDTSDMPSNKDLKDRIASKES